MTKNIVFTKTLDISDKYYPAPASKYLPEWYKKTQSYLGNPKDINYNAQTNATIKKCIPIFDAITSGYIITTHCDILIKKNNNEEIMFIPSNLSVPSIEFHSIQQAPYHPGMNHHPYPKFINPWSIKTPPGYSCLFIPPIHSDHQYFKIFEGIVDTDKYINPVNFPFVLTDTSFSGIIPADTPIVQIIPFKRTKWISKLGNDFDHKNIKENLNELNTKFFDRYKTFFWNRKSYK